MPSRGAWLKTNCRPDVAGARHVARNDGRIARDVVGEMPRHHAGIGIEAAPNPGADHEIDRLALVKIGLRGGRRRGQQGRGQQDRQCPCQDVCRELRNAHKCAPAPSSRGEKAIGVAAELAGRPCERQVKRAGRGWGGPLGSRPFGADDCRMGLSPGLKGNIVRCFRCVDRKKLLGGDDEKFDVAFGARVSADRRARGGSGLGLSGSSAGIADPDPAKVVKVPGSDKQYTETQINDAFAPPDWFPADPPRCHPSSPTASSRRCAPARSAT